jgi:GH24 family phage-related lysozyme (muramidase)
MQQAPTATLLTRKQICKTIFYTTPDGQLMVVPGNTHLIVSPEEATACFQRLLDSTALYRQLLAPERITGDLVASHNGTVS